MYSTIKKCKTCKKWMIPLGDIWLHPSSDCEDGGRFIVSPESEKSIELAQKEYGVPEFSYQQMIDRFNETRNKDFEWMNRKIMQKENELLNAYIDNCDDIFLGAYILLKISIGDLIGTIRNLFLHKKE